MELKRPQQAVFFYRAINDNLKLIQLRISYLTLKYRVNRFDIDNIY